jgi:hypothetical protein
LGQTQKPDYYLTEKRADFAADLDYLGVPGRAVAANRLVDLYQVS